MYLSDMQAKVSVSSRGAVALPAAMHKAAGIRTQSGIIAETTAEGILLRPAVTLPVELYTQERIAEFDAAESRLEKAVERSGLLQGRRGVERASSGVGGQARAAVAGAVPAVAGSAGAGAGGFAEGAVVSRMARRIEGEACKPRGRP